LCVLGFQNEEMLFTVIYEIRGTVNR
jgi:hypothetical protein